MASPAWADQLSVVFPTTGYQTTAERIFFIGTAPPVGTVSVNNQVIERSPAGHFAPSFPLQMGDNLFTLRYQHQQVQINVKRLSTAPEPPVGLAFGKNSLVPSVDIARLPGELICFSAIAPANATVTVQLSNQTIPLLPQSPRAQLPANCAALTGQVLQPSPPQSVAAQYQGCTTVGTQPLLLSSLDLGKPQFRLTLNGKTITQMGSGKIQILSLAQLDVAEVTADSGVARTGSGRDYSRLTPLPKGTRATVIGQEGEWLRLDYGGWINAKETTILRGLVPPRSLIRSISVRRVLGATEVVFPLQVPVPISVQQGDRTFTLTLYNTTAQTDIIRLDDAPLISRLDWQQSAPGQVQYTFNFKSSQQWGYKLRYEGTNLVLTLRHSPGGAGELGAPTEWGLGAAGEAGEAVGEKKPLSGVKILLDPGHGGTETGALGPTGYPEKDLNLIIGKLVREQLLARGATVYMTREEDQLVSLVDRLAMINQLEPAIAISIHHNSLPDEGDAMYTQGFSAFWYNTQAHSLASFLNNYIVSKLDKPSYGLYWDNLALTRPTVAPSVLLELGFMSNPVEFESLMNPQEQRNMALAIADGITQWFTTTQ